MGDYCSLEISFLEVDWPQFERLSGWSRDYCEHEVEGRVVTVTFAQVNYGLTDGRQRVARGGMTFIGVHDAGGNYGPCAFVALNGTQIEVETDWVGRPTVGVSGNGAVDESQLATVREYLSLCRTVNAQFGLADDSSSQEVTTDEPSGTHQEAQACCPAAP